MEKLFAVTTPGLEPFTAQELRAMGLAPVDQPEPRKKARRKSGRHRERSQGKRPSRRVAGGVLFSGDLDAIYRANLSLRTANRVLVRLGEFYAAAFSELRKKAGRLAWERYLNPGQPVALRVSCRKSRLYHSDAVAERVAGAIGDRLGQPPPVQKFDQESDSPLPQLVLVRLARDQCTISVDTSGALLHRRGYRLATAKAPLRETLAAGMLLAAGWDTQSPLLDPFCGSGTIPIEAALMARNADPGCARRFAFMNWPGFDPDKWGSLLEGGRSQVPAQLPIIMASDRDAGAVEMARENAERAGIGDAIEFSCRAVSAIETTGTGWAVTNPPYGRRVSGGKDLRNLYAQFGKVLRAKCPGWRVAILCSDPRLIHNTGLDLHTNLSTDNGGVRVKLAQGVVPS